MKPFALPVLVLVLLVCVFADSRKRRPSPPEKKIVLSLQPGENNPRNSEGSFVTLKDGRILFVYSHYTGGSTSDHAPAYLAGRYSSDNGKTWTTTDELIVRQEGTMNVMSVSLLRLKNGSIAMFYLKKNSVTDCIPLMRISTDEAKTWSDPVPCITDRQGYFVLNNDRVIQLTSGRLLMAVAMHQEPGGTWSNTGRLWSYYSDDNGKTWKSGKEVSNPQSIITQEPGLVELQNGNILMFIRAGGGFQQYSRSSDKGETWTPIEKSSIASPISPASIERIPGKKDLLLVWNNNDGSDSSIRGKRTPFNIAISSDEGVSWKKIKTLQNDPDGWYCYTAIHFTKDGVLLGNCAGSRSKKTELSITDISLIDFDWIYQ